MVATATIDHCQLLRATPEAWMPPAFLPARPLLRRASEQIRRKSLASETNLHDVTVKGLVTR
jgi:hypothetical protein